MRRRFSIFLLLVVFPVVSFAQQTLSLPTDATPKTILDFKDELALKPEQVEKLKKIIDDFEGSAQPLLSKIVSLNKETRELLGKEEDLAKIKPKIKEVFSLRADLVIMEIEAGRKIDKVLTKEQLAKWREIKKKGGKK